MYIRVHRKGNQWFRNDNGALVGKEISSIKELSYLRIIHGNHILAKDTNNEIHIILEGYLDKEENLIRFCTSKDCTSCSMSKRTMFCKKEHSTIKDKTSGYYISD